MFQIYNFYVSHCYGLSRTLKNPDFVLFLLKITLKSPFRRVVITDLFVLFCICLVRGE